MMLKDKYNNSTASDSAKINVSIDTKNIPIISINFLFSNKITNLFFGNSIQKETSVEDLITKFRELFKLASNLKK